MIKIYDSSLGEYVVVASNRGDKLYTENINFATPDSSIITIDEALTSLSNEIKSVKEGVAWVYKNGTIGGGGSGGGSGLPKFKVTTKDGIIKEDSIIVNNNQTLTLSFTITGTSLGRKMNISIKDNKGNFYGYNNSTYTTSSKATNIQIPNITNDLIIEFTGYDQETLSIIESYTLSVKVSTLKITGPDSIEISKSNTEYNLNYNITTTYGQSTYVMLSTVVNNVTYEYVSETFINSQPMSFNIFNIFEGLELENILKGDSPINNMDITAKVVAGEYYDEIITSIVFTSEDKVSIDIVPITNVNGETPSYEYIENDNLSFTIKLYFSSNEFYMYYELYQLINEEKVIVFKKGDINNPSSEDNKISSAQYYSKNNPITLSYPNNIDVTKPVYVYVKAWDKNNQMFNGESTKWFGIKSDENWKPYNISLSGKDVHIDGGLNYLYYEYNSNNFNNIKISDYIESSRYYKGSSINDTLIKGSIKYYNANNITNGVLLRGKSNENVNTLRMSSNSYGVFYDANNIPFKPFSNNKDNWMLNPNGWSISLSFKSDTQANKDNVVFSYASFDNLGKFSEGIYITTTEVNVKLTNSTKQVSKWDLNAKLSQNVYNQVDIVYIPKTLSNGNKTTNIGELRIYVNGVLAKAGIETNINFDNNNYYPTINSNMVIGATHNGKEYSNYSDVNFYRILFYKKALTPYHITKNLLQGKAEVEVLEDGNIDKTTNNELRKKNFFNSDGTCSIINKETYATGECKYIDNLYSELSTSSVNPLPIVLVKVAADFRSVMDNRYTESQVAADKASSTPTITKEYDAVITIVNEYSNKPFIMGKNGGDLAIGDNSGKDCTVKLQGTSTLGNKSKNLEISFGASKQADNTIKENLVQIFEDMLPENSWIAKADVMDSGHANNAAIGGFINDFLSTYNTTANQMNNNMYAKEIKATTTGHPVMMFIQFGDNAPQEFLGIYSMNLGRISYYNLGYQIFDGYYKVISSKNDVEKEVVYKNHKVEDTTIEFPALVSSYKTVAIPYNNTLSGVDANSTTAVCYECKGNNNIVGTFQQSDNNVINEFYYRVYPNVDNSNTSEAFKRFRKLFVAMSNLYECDPEYLCKMEEGDEYLKTRSLLARNSKGEFYNNETSSYEAFNKNNYIANKYKLQDSWSPSDSFLSLTTSQTNENENHIGLNWEFASAYFTLAMLFGLTDSLGKNLNIRSFDLSDWYISFYDMDTGLGLTNAGYETVKDDVYLDKFSLNSNKQEIDVKINGYKEGGYDTINSRLFNIIRFFTNKNYTNTGTKPDTNYRKIWEDIRKTVLRSPDNFIDNYYIKQNKNVGEIIFNYDYDIKYINDEVDMIANPNANITSGSINFLHGNRVNFVRDWFTTHVFFLDGVFDIKCKAPLTNETKELYGNAAGTQYYGIIVGDNNIESDQTFNDTLEGVVCPYITESNQGDRVNPSFDGYKDFTIKSNIPMFFIYNNGTLNQRLFIEENNLTNVKLYFKSGNEQTMTFNYASYLTLFDKFGTLSYVNMTKPNLSSLMELDLSNTTVLSGASFDISSLIELRKLNMNNTKTTSGKSIEVNLQNASKISYIDLRNANVHSLTLPGYGDNPGGSLEEIYIDETTITNVDLSGHAMLKKFSAKDCKNINSLIFNYNELLNDIGTIPTSISNLIFDECNSLTTINLNSMEKLTNEGFYLGHLENLKTFSYSHKKSKEIPVGITNLDFSGCPNIEDINLIGFEGEYITLNKKSQKTLKTLNISNSNINYIVWYDTENDEKIYSTINGNKEGIIDLMLCENIESVNISNQKNIKYLLLPSTKTISNIIILGCDSLERIVGRISVNVNMFTKLHNFRFNEVCKYNNDDNTSIIKLNYETGEVELEEEYLPLVNNNEDGDLIIEYELDKLLTHYTFLKDGASISNSFNDTGINITDLYAILLKLKGWTSAEYVSESNPNGYITEFNKTFSSCWNIKCGQIIWETTPSGTINSITYNSKYLSEQEDIKIDIFEGFNHLNSLISTFEKCYNICGNIVSLSDNKNNIFKYIPTLTTIDNVFNECGNIYINNYIFQGNKNLVEIVKPFSNSTDITIGVKVQNGITISKNRYLNCNEIYYNLTSLRKIQNVFYNTNVMYNFKDKTFDNIFKTNTNLEIINYCLPKKYTNSSSNKVDEINLGNIFGGYDRYLIQRGEKSIENFDNLYPRKLKDISYAFATEGEDINQPMLNWDNMDYIFYNQLPDENNNLSLETCAYAFNKLAYVKDGDNDGYNNYTSNGNGTIAKFPINMFNFDNSLPEGTIHPKFNKLQSCEGLFMRSAFKEELKFPGNIFKYCNANKLNLSHLFEDTVITPIKLVNVTDNYSCFTNCKLDDISFMFKNCFKGIDKKEYLEGDYKTTLYKYDRGGLQGTIPYNFFKHSGTGITNMESIFEGCCNLGTKVDLICDENGDYNSGTGDFVARDESCFYNIKKPELTTLRELSETNEEERDYSKLLDLVEFENGVWEWNAWSYDGTTFDEEYLELLNGIVLNGKNYTEAKHTNIVNYIDLKWKNYDSDNKLIQPSFNIENDIEHCEYNSDNQKKSLLKSAYDTSLIEVKDNDGVIVPMYRIYYDADYDIKNINFSNDKVEQLWHCNSFTQLDREYAYEQYTHETDDANTKTTKFISNYMIPMDIFRYCNVSCNINNVFRNLSRFNNDDKRNKFNDYVYGLIGRIPPKLFYPLTGVEKLIGVFEGCKGIIPYAQSTDGLLYSYFFNENKKLKNISRLFSETMILGSLSNKIFNNNLEINELDSTFKNAYMPKEYGINNVNYVDYINFIPKDLFAKNTKLVNLSSLFAKDNNDNTYNSKNAYLYFDIDDNFLTNIHKNALENVSNIFAYQNNNGCGIQRKEENKDIWINFKDFPRVKNYSNSYTGSNFDLSLIDTDMGGKKEIN